MNATTRKNEIAKSVAKLSMREAIAFMLAQPIPNTEKARLLVDLGGITKNEAAYLIKVTCPSAPRTRTPQISFTYGVEIECIANHEDIYRAVTEKGVDIADHFSGWMRHENRANTEHSYKIMSDGSVHEGCTYGSEVVTPVLKGAKGFKSLKTVCEALKSINAKVNKTCGLHVHIGAANLTSEQYANVFVNYMFIEKAIDKFMAESRRENNASYARSLINRGLSSCTTRDGIYGAIGNSRYYKVNACSYSAHKTIEFRQHQGTTNYTKIRAWVLFLGKLVEWSKTNRLTSHIEDINEIPFLTAREKSYFVKRATKFGNND